MFSHWHTDTEMVFLDTLALSAYAAGASVVILLVHLLLRFEPQCTNKSRADSTSVPEDNSLEDLGAAREGRAAFLHHVAQLGGPGIFAYRSARLLACMTLLCLSAFPVLSERQGRTTVVVPRSVWLDVGLCGAYAYASLLAVVSVSAKPRLGRLVTRHLACLLVVVWAVYVYRDIWPLATFTLTPADTAEGSVFWVKFAVLTFGAVVVPLLVPRQYIPLFPKEPLAVPAEEQTASFLSMMLYMWMDETVWAASSVPHLSLERFPRMADYDYAKNLATRSYPYVDPFHMKKDRHLFFGLVRVFAVEHFWIGSMLALRVFAYFLSPIVINRLLNYLETGGKDAIVRPWLWISFLFIGPMLGCIAFMWFAFNSTRMWTHIQAILTQLVFDHALRMRVKAETSDGPASGATTAVATPDTASIAEPAMPGAQGDENGGGDETAGPSAPEADPAAPEARGQNFSGKLNNLITTDMGNLTRGTGWLYIAVEVPLQSALCIYFLYVVLGWSAFVGLAAMVVLMPIPGLLANLLQSVQEKKMKKTDVRVQSVTETMSAIRMIKLFGWEPRVTEQLLEKRDDELALQRKFKFLDTGNNYITIIIPLATLAVTFASFTVIQKGKLTASRVFSSMAVMDMLKYELQVSLGVMPGLIQAKVSLDRINVFLRKTELLDKFAALKDLKHRPDPAESLPHVESDVIGVREATFSWTDTSDGSTTPVPRRRNFLLRIDEELTFKRGHINLIVGPTGSGKTSLLMALLGEMHYMPSGLASRVSLPRGGGIAYAAQESWVQSETIRDNILFGAPYDEERYDKVVEQCALQRDLSLFDAGDKTEVGEKGLTLSGGQKARITLARAVYSSAEILLLDDVLAALDVLTAKWIVDKCFKGDLIRGRTVLLVTHNMALASPIADFVVSLGKDGRIHSQGSLSKALAENKELSVELAKESKEIEQDDIGAEEKTADGKLIVSEEISEGRVGWPAWKMFLTNVGGARPITFWLFYATAMTLSELFWTVQIWALGLWAKQYEDHLPEEVSVSYYLSIYGLLTLVAVIFYAIAYITFVVGVLRAARVLHKLLITSVLGTTLRWLDVTPTARIIARCTTDFQTIDNYFSDCLLFLLDTSFSMALKLGAIFVISPIFLIPGVLMTMSCAWLGGLYLKAQLSAQREVSNANAPRVEHFAAAIAGLTSIRAYGAEDALRRELRARIDRYTRAHRTVNSLSRWVSTRVEAFGATFVTVLATYLIYGQDLNASSTGFTLKMAVSFSSMTLWWVLHYNEVQVKANSLERIQQYLTIEQEPKPTKRGVPPAYWPASGNLTVEKLSARYSTDGPRVLQDISFQVKSGERVGIVGRTGSGKSSLTLALLRLIPTEGKVYYDSMPTDTMNLTALRSNVTIIPQVPELLSGTLRQNLDPFQQYDDAVLNDALRAAGLFSVQNETNDAHITLDSLIASGGGNLSVGQRQILALARAIVRQSKLLILDEATSAIDYETDQVIQTSLRELAKDVTLLTVAHRLQTIMDADKIMVLDAGRIAEFGPPSELLKNERGLLRALVDESRDKDTLYAMAMRASTSLL